MGKLGASILPAELAGSAGRVKLAEQDADLIHVTLMDAPVASGLTIELSLVPAVHELVAGVA